MKIRFLSNALKRMKARGSSQYIVESALRGSDETFDNEIGFVAHKLIVLPPSSKQYLLKISYQLSEQEIEVISVYRTSQIEKY
ncbi:MAG: hypothetical protein ACFFB3_05990 [Candidatus Hodarchaeota archaeon]